MTVKKILLFSLILAAMAASLYVARQLGSIWLANRLQAAGLALQAKPEIHFFTPGVNLGNLSWQANLHKFRLQFSATALQATPRLASLLRGKLELEEIRIQTPVLRISAADSAATDMHNFLAPLPAIARLVCQDGQVEWRRGDHLLRLSNLRLTAANIIPREEFDLQSDFILAIAAPGLPAITSNSALRTKARYYAPNLSLRDLHATATLTEPSSLASFSPLALELNGSFDFESERCRIQIAKLGLPAFEITGGGSYVNDSFTGDVALTSLKPLPFATYLKLTSPLVAQPEFLRLPAIGVGLDNCKGSGSLEIGFLPGASPKITASFRMGTLQIPEQASQRKDSHLTTTIPQISSLPDFRIGFAFTEIRRGDLRLTSPTLEITGGNDSVALNHLSCQLGEGIFHASGSANFKRNLWQLAANGENLPLGLLLRQAGIDGFMDGPANLKLQFAIPSDHGQFLLPGLAGNASLEFKNLRLAFLQDLASLLPVLGPASEISDIVKNGKLIVNAFDGQLNISSFQFSGDGLRGNGDGRINLAEQTVDGNFDLFLGKLKIPLSFAGPLAHPAINLNSPLLETLH